MLVSSKLKLRVEPKTMSRSTSLKKLVSARLKLLESDMLPSVLRPVTVTELLVMAPIKPGFVPSLESVTYKTRVKTLLRLLHVARSSSHEYRLLRAVSDAVERVGVIHTLRVAVIEGKNESEDKVLLSVNFDGWVEHVERCLVEAGDRLPADIDRHGLAGLRTTRLQQYR